METEDTVMLEHSEKDSSNDENFDEPNNEQIAQESSCATKESELIDQKPNWSVICRICAQSNDHIIPIFEAEGAEHDLKGKIDKYLPIRVTKSDTLPMQLCYHCAATILAWDELLEGCLDAEKQLLQMQAEQRRGEQLESRHDENVVEELVDDPEPTEGAKKESNLARDQREETEQSDLGEETKRSGRATGAFRVFLDKQKVCQGRKRIKNEKRNESEIGMWREVSDTRETISLTSLISPELGKDARDDRIEKSKISGSSQCNTKNLRSSKHKETQEPIDYREANSDDESLDMKKSRSCEEFYDPSEFEEDTSELENEKSKEVWKCGECSKTFRRKNSFKRHLRIHRDERPFTCHVCGKQFRDSGGLSRHLKDVHAKVKKFTCDICASSFSAKATRDDHRRTHTGERPYNCENCEKSFKTRAALYIHSKLHTNEFPHSCAYCEKKFRRRQEMLVHLSTHSGEKNFSCDICYRRFRVKHEVARHKLTHSNEKPYICSKCGLSFRQNRYLNYHIKLRHSQRSKD